MSETFAAVVDWGTSSFRAWLMSTNGMVQGTFESPHGMAKLKPEEFGPHLENALSILKAEATTPVLMCGMVGAAQGWHQAPYLETPAHLAEIPQRAVRLPQLERDVRILPGICQKQPEKWDVMRGEETLLYGATLHSNQSSIVCLPGTHSKWAVISDRTVQSFSTAMTGELFSLLSEHSTLASYAHSKPADCRWAAFDAAVQEVRQAPQAILNKLFTIRSMPLLLKGDTAKSMPDRLSGLLIGLEIAGVNIENQAPVLLVANGGLADRYRRALQVFGIDATVSNSTDTAQQGLFHAAQEIWQ